MRKDKVLIVGAACAVIALFQAPTLDAENMATVGFIDAAKGLLFNVIEDTAASNSRRAIAAGLGVGSAKPTRNPAVAG